MNLNKEILFIIPSNLTVTKDMVERFKPIIYVPKEPTGFQLINVLYEIFQNFAILWYHWPFDDYTEKPDYEPVILVFNDTDLVAIGIRPHENHTYSVRWLTEGTRPVIVFETPWHGPVIFRGAINDGLTAAFTSSLFSDRIDEYDVTEGKPPQWYIKDGTAVEIYEYAEQIASVVLKV